MYDDSIREQTLDEIAEEAGGYVRYLPRAPMVAKADCRTMSRYCIEWGITSDELTDEEYRNIMSL